MKTEVIKINPQQIESEKIRYAAKFLQEGKTVCFPTETVYGLGANALCADAVKKIFAAKGRPADNPLIVHICNLSDAQPLIASCPDMAKQLAQAFWPGPLTMVLQKSALVPPEVSAGLNTVAVRNPVHPIARSLIQEAKLPVAAPSANLSGKPSPTAFSHVFEDLNGRVDLIIDGGPCAYGLESTVVSLQNNKNIILRPGSITKEMLTDVLNNVTWDKHLIDHTTAQKPLAPGMKYKHYAPKAQVIVVRGTREQMIHYINSHVENGEGIMAFSEDMTFYPNQTVLSLGSRTDLGEAAHQLFACLRQADQLGLKTVYCEDVEAKGVGFAVQNRLYKAAGNQIIDLGDNNYR